MKWPLTFLLITGLSFSILAQNPPCYYSLHLSDAAGDGWNGAGLMLDIDGQTTFYTLDNGSAAAFYLPLLDGQSVTLTFQPGLFDDEVGFSLFNERDSLLTSFDGASDFYFTFAAACPACPAPPVQSITVSDIRATTANINWLAPDPNATYRVYYEATDFFIPIEDSLDVVGNTARLQGLYENAEYEFSIVALCSAGDTSRLIGPFRFQTIWANDVGIQEILYPQTGCGLDANDTLGVVIRNYGANPQSLIPFAYSVNGVPANIDMPKDGVYTGVLGSDSADVAEFDQTIDLAAPGEYLIEAWTEMESDSARYNDTVSITVISIPTINQTPYFENFETWSGGWMIATGDQEPSWQRAIPNGSQLNRALSGRFAWATNPDGAYQNGELSFLVSPCLDFTGFDQDPVLSFALRLDLEPGKDVFWVDISRDGGTTWGKLGDAVSGINWYNDTQRNAWSGDGGFKGWFRAAYPLLNTADSADIRLRFSFRSDLSNALEGVLIDDVSLVIPDTEDLVAGSADRLSPEACGAADDQIVLSIINLGATPATGFDVSYQVNNGPVVSENVGAFSVDPGASRDYLFSGFFDSSQPGSYAVKAWVDADGNDLITANDTAYFEFFTALPVPYAEAFERGGLPEGWVASQQVLVTNGHNNTSFVLSQNMYSGAPAMEATSPVFGPAAAADTLRFDYRIVNFNGDGTIGTSLGSQDRLTLSISTDCGITFTPVTTIDQSNHLVSNKLRTVEVPLADYAGAFIQLKFTAAWGTGDYWIDIDHINLISCPEELPITIAVADPFQLPVEVVALPDAGGAPFTYQWNDGSTGAFLFITEPGTYEVLVTDRFGCTGAASYSYDPVSTDERYPFGELKLFPNPTAGTAELQFSLSKAAKAELRLFNAFGQQLFQTRTDEQTLHHYRLDLSRWSDGLYLLQIRVHDQVRTEKLLKSSF